MISFELNAIQLNFAIFVAFWKTTKIVRN